MTTSGPHTVSQALTWATAALDDRVDAEYLLMHLLQCSRTHLITHATTALSEEQWQSFGNLVQRRQAGEPVAYITGSRGFWSLELSVTPDVLIPRPDTELLVETVLELADNSLRRTVVDLGTGSGAIALAIAAERPAWRVIATDASEAALNVARRNAWQLGLDRVEFFHGNWCAALPSDLVPDIIVSNPPYIAPDDPHLLQGDLRFEPMSALKAEDNGLGDIRQITEQAKALLPATGTLLFEHGYQQAAAVREILAAAGLVQVRSLYDLGGHERVTLGVKP